MAKRFAAIQHERDRHLLAAGDPLLRAYYERNMEKLEEMLEAKKSEIERLLGESNPLACLAAIENRVDVLSLIYTLNGDLHILNRKKLSPVHLSVMHSSFDAMVFLLEKGMDVNEGYPNGDFLLHKACATGEPDFVEFLLTAGADPNAKNAINNLPLHKACEEDNFVMAQLLIPKTENINGEGSEGRTAMHFAAANQSLNLIKLLLAYGANIDCYDVNNESPMDIIVSMGNKNIIVGLAKFLVHSISGDFYTYQELALSPEFEAVTQLIGAIDNEMEHPIRMKEEDEDSKIAKQIINKINSEEKIDFLEFRKMVHNIVRLNISHLIIENHLIDTFAILVCQQVLYREDVELLRIIIYETSLWPLIQTSLEENIAILYEMSQEIGSTGMVSLIHEEFFDDDGELEMDYFYSFVANLTSLPQLEATKNAHIKTKVQKDPLTTLTIWSVFSGRFELTEDLLKTEQFDIIPLGLLTANILRKLKWRKEIPTPTKLLMENVADCCESVTVKVLREVNEMDTSDNKIISITYMTEPMVRYSGRSTIDLAADGFSENFITMQSVQNALDIEWFKKLYSIHWFVRDVLIILSVLPFNLITAFTVKRIREKKDAEKRAIQEAQGNALEEYDELTLNSFTKSRGSENILAKGSEQRKSTLKKSLSTTKDGEQQKDEDTKMETTSSKSLLFSGDAGGDDPKKPTKKLRPTKYDEGKKNIFSELLDIMVDFYMTPAVKFRYHVMMHIIFVLLFSVVIVAQFSYKINIAEIIVYTFILGFVLEELNEINEALQMGTLTSYITDGWNMIDNCAICLGVIGFSMRMARISSPRTDPWMYLFVDDYFWWAHVVLAISCLLYWIRLLYISTVLESLGPKLKMIYVMIIRDFVPFLIILVIIMFGFGIAMHGLLFPNGYASKNPTPLSSMQIFQRMFKVTFYAMVGDYSLDLIEGSDCEGKNMCPHPLGKIIVLNVIMVIYIVITTVLLLNLIIALFSKTVEEIDKKSFALWQFERYQLVEEFNIRFPLPPPFNILGLVLNKAKNIFKAYKARGREKYRGQKKFDKSSFISFLVFQAFALRRKRKDIVGEIEVEDPDKLISEINNNVKQLNKKLETLTKKVNEKSGHGHSHG